MSIDVEAGRFRADTVEKLDRYAAAFLGVCPSARHYLLVHSAQETEGGKWVPDPLHFVVVDRPVPEVKYLWGALARATGRMVVCYMPVSVEQAKALRAVAALEGPEESRKLLASWNRNQLMVLTPRRPGVLGR